MSDWYYAQNDEHFGPVTAAALKEMARVGKLSREDLIWRDGMERWAPAHKVRGLFPDVAVGGGSGSENGTAAHSGSSASSTAVAATITETEQTAPPKDADKEVIAADEDDGSVEAETAIDVLPLAGPEESKLHMPALGTPAGEEPSSVGGSNEFVVFEPATGSPPGPTQPPPKSPPKTTPASESTPDTSPAAQVQTRVDAAHGRRPQLAAGVALFLQTFTWVSCLLVIIVGGGIYVTALVINSEPTDRLAASGVYAAFVAASYFLARGTERFCHVLSRWFDNSEDAKSRRSVRQRNWNRFQ